MDVYFRGSLAFDFIICVIERYSREENIPNHSDPKYQKEKHPHNQRQTSLPRPQTEIFEHHQTKSQPLKQYWIWFTMSVYDFTHPAKAPPRCAAQEVRIFTSLEIISKVTMTSLVTKAAIGKNLCSFSEFWVFFSKFINFFESKTNPNKKPIPFHMTTV